MIEISFWKILVACLVALLVLGPEHLPKAARTVGRLLKQVRATLGAIQKELQLDANNDKQDDLKK